MLARTTRLLATVALTAGLAVTGTVARVVGAAAPAGAVEADVATTRVVGDLAMADGTTLRYTVVMPVAAAPRPTLFEYSGYDPGTNPDVTYVSQYVTQGGHYNYIGVNLRGTGCSSGTFDFFQPAEAKDGAAVVEWIAAQPWSDGKVGMIGKSYPGITQLFVAEQQPPHLTVIAPGHFFNEAYRDIARPGGIQNYGFASLWSFLGRPSYEFESGTTELVEHQDTTCANATSAEVRGLPTNPFVQLQSHLFEDDLIRERSPQTHVDKLTIPMLATESWEDEQLDSRGTDLLAQIDDLNAQRASRGEAQTPWWLDVSNGDHGMARTAYGYAVQRQFYDHFLRGVDNGWTSRPRVTVGWEDGRNGDRLPGWITNDDHWSEAQRRAEGRLSSMVLNLRAGGGLTGAPAAVGEPSETYAYTPVGGSQGIGNPAYSGVSSSIPSAYLWPATPPPGTAASWTTAPFPADRTLLGSGSFDVWLQSTAPDTDLQVTLTEVRPDGQEVYLQKGWLKASQRALDPVRSTELRPYQTHLQTDSALLSPTTPVLARVELFPFGALVRKGSRLRVWVEAPTTVPELWAFTPFPVPAVNTVLHDAAHPSRLVLPLVPNDDARLADYPTCGNVIRQPCRTDAQTASAVGPVDATPTPAVPDAPWAVLLPVAGLATAALGLRRRTPRNRRG